MNSITRKAYGKINLSLDVTGRREDGYHLVRMIMQTVGIYDTVTIRTVPFKAGAEASAAQENPEKTVAGRSVGEKTEPAGQQGRETVNGITIRTDSGEIPSGPDNLMWRAADVMRRQFGITDGLDISVEKRIPVAAGMAGGSTDAAAVFCGIRGLYDLDISDQELEKLALPLGADIPYCICGGTQLSEGIGEILTKLPAAPQCALIVVKPDLYVSTGEVYREFDSIPAAQIHHPDVNKQADAIRAQNLRMMASACGNVLEQKTGAAYPVIGELEEFFRIRGALTSIMTGSGPAVFAVYADRQQAENAFRELQSEKKYKAFQKFLTGFVTP